MKQPHKVWRHNMEQWDANDIDPPDLIVDAFDSDDAATRWAARRGPSDDEAGCIVQDPDGQYYEIELARKWEVSESKPTTIEKLCEP